MSKLFSSYSLKETEFKNRIVMPPMCMYSADDKGNIMPWHYNHYVSRAIGGTGLIVFEATAVESRGRITDQDLGIWNDAHIEGLRKVVEECKKYGAVVGVQIAHAGRKCQITSEDIIAPSPIAFSDKYKVPREMSKEDIKQTINSFREAAKRAKKVGFDVVQIHGAHGYLINEFMSPITNKRDDEYGGKLENRARFLKEVIKAVREEWAQEYPLILRVSAEEYLDEGNHPEDVAKIINLVKSEGVDMINVSSGGVARAKIDTYSGYQIKYAEEIRRMTKLPVVAGGLITSASMAEEIIQNNRGDFVYLGRELLRNPYWPLNAAKELGDDIEWPVQYSMAK